MQLKCRSCGAELHSRDVNFDALRASCRACGWQLGGDGAYRQPAPTLPAQTAEPALPPLPAFVEVLDTADGRHLEVVIRNPRRVVFYVVLTLFSAMMLTMAATSKNASAGATLIVVLLILAAGWAGGTWLANTRRLRVYGRWLSIHHYPFPQKTIRIPIADIQQLWVDEYDIQRETNFRLCAQLHDGQNVPLITMLPEPSAALHLERRIEHMLGIQDRPVIARHGRHYAELTAEVVRENMRPLEPDD